MSEDILKSFKLVGEARVWFHKENLRFQFFNALALSLAITPAILSAGSEHLSRHQIIILERSCIFCRISASRSLKLDDWKFLRRFYGGVADALSVKKSQSMTLAQRFEEALRGFRATHRLVLDFTSPA